MPVFAGPIPSKQPGKNNHSINGYKNDRSLVQLKHSGLNYYY